MSVIFKLKYLLVVGYRMPSPCIALFLFYEIIALLVGCCLFMRSCQIKI
jgi:hypothetical protein